MSETRQRILDDIKTAMKAGDKPRLATLRLMSAAIKQREVDERIELDEESVIVILDKMLKQRRESITQYSKAGRDDLVAVEQTESDLIQAYLPAQLSDEEIIRIVEAAVTESGAASVKDMGKVMGLVKPQMQGRADMASVSKIIKDRLNAK
ncbi:MAG: GatB/YqeY domain-containing protein [Granulosicoccus sp.]